MSSACVQAHRKEGGGWGRAKLGTGVQVDPRLGDRRIQTGGSTVVLATPKLHQPQVDVLALGSS